MSSSAHLLKVWINTKNANLFCKRLIIGDVFFPEGASPLWVGLMPKPLVSRKGGSREVISEGSGTTKVGTNEQELDTRHDKQDKVTQHTNVPMQRRKLFIM